MSSCYKILKTSIEGYPYIVFAANYTNPMDQKDALEKDLKKIGVKGKFLFDLLLSHGNTPDRFFEAIFNGEKINEDSLKSVEAISKEIRKISLEFFHSQQDMLEKSVLSKSQKSLIRRRVLL
jgi:hypothetical protein